MVSVCLPSDALLQHLPSYLGFSYLGHGVSLHGCSSKAQRLLLTLDEGYFLTATLPDLLGIALLDPPVPAQPLLLGCWLIFLAAIPGLGRRVAPPSPQPRPRMLGGSSRPLPLTSDLGWLLPATAPVLRHGVAPLGHSCAITAWHSWRLPLISNVG